MLPESLTLVIGERGGSNCVGSAGWRGAGSRGTSVAPLLCVTLGQPLPLWASVALSLRQGGHHLSPFALCLSTLSWFLGLYAAPSRNEESQSTGHLSRPILGKKPAHGPAVGWGRWIPWRAGLGELCFFLGGGAGEKAASGGGGAFLGFRQGGSQERGLLPGNKKRTTSPPKKPQMATSRGIYIISAG